MRAAAAGAAIAIPVALAALAARHAQHPESSPVTPAGHWNAIWTASVVVATVAYIVAMIVCRRSMLGIRSTLVLAVVVQTLPLVGPLLLSKDAYLYWSEARIISVHHANPYRAIPADYPADPATPYVSEEWRNGPAPYGPTWEALAVVPAVAAGTSPDRAQFAYRVLSLAGVLVALGVLARRTRSAAAVALLGWSPLVALHFAGGGHSDSWLVALLVIAVTSRRRAGSGAAWALAAAMKPVPIVLFPLELAGSRLRRTRAFWLGGVVTAAAIVAVSGAVWGLHWIRTALVGVHGTSPLGGVHWLTQAGLSHHDAVAAGAIVFAAVYCLLLVDAWRRSRPRHALAATALCLTTSLLRPWYGIWPLALAAVEEDSAGVAAAVALSAYLLLGDAVHL